MKKTLIMTVVAITFITGCAPYGVAKKGKQQKVEPEDSVTVTRYEPSGPVNLTFLDTLNKGNEIGLSDSDFQKNASPSLGAEIAQNQNSLYYKIQLFASSQIETIREQKREMESKITLPLTISFESPYYKLLAGNFALRSEAETQLKKIKKLGYTDAWIISTEAVNN